MGRLSSNDGETIKTPGMIRWFNNSHYFLKRIGTRSAVTKPHTFVLGLENRFGDDAYSYSCGIEFDNDEAPDLMDRIASFNGLPKYTTLKATVDALRELVRETDRMDRPEDYYFQRKLHGILDDLDLER
jgi:hypothetical protein